MNETNSNFDETFGVNNNTLDQLDVSDIIQNGNSNSGIGDNEQSLEPLNAVNDQNHQFPDNTTVESTDDTPNNCTIGMIIKVKQQVKAKIIEVLELRAKVEESHTADKQEEEIYLQLQEAEGQLYSLYELKCKLFSSLHSQGRYAEARLMIWKAVHGLDNSSIRRIQNELVHVAANGGAGSGDSSVGSSSNSGSDKDDMSIRDTSTNDELNHQSPDNTIEEEVAAAESPVKEAAVTPPLSTNQDVPDSTASQQHDDYIPTALKSQISNQEDELTNLLSSIDQLQSTPGRIALMLHNDEDTDEGLVGIVDMSNVSSGDGRGGVMRSGGLSPVKKRLIMDNGDTSTEESLVEEEVKEEVESLVVEEEFKYKSPPEVKVPATPASLPQSTTDNTLPPPTGANVSLLNSAKSTSKEMSQDKALHDSKRMTKQQQVNASPIEVVTGEVDSMTSTNQSSYNTSTLLIPTLCTNGEEQRGTDNQEVTSATATIEKKNDTSMADEYVDSSEEKKLALKEKMLIPASSDSFDTGSSDDNVSLLEAHRKKKSTQHEQANGNAANVQASKRNTEEDAHSADESPACTDPVLQSFRKQLMNLDGNMLNDFKEDFSHFTEESNRIIDKWNKRKEKTPEKSPKGDTSAASSPSNNEDLIHVDGTTTDTDSSPPETSTGQQVGEDDSPTKAGTIPIGDVVCQEGSNSSDTILGSNCDNGLVHSTVEASNVSVEKSSGEACPTTTSSYRSGALDESILNESMYMPTSSPEPKDIMPSMSEDESDSIEEAPAEYTNHSIPNSGGVNVVNNVAPSPMPVSGISIAPNSGNGGNDQSTTPETEAGKDKVITNAEEVVSPTEAAAEFDQVVVVVQSNATSAPSTPTLDGWEKEQRGVNTVSAAQEVTSATINKNDTSEEKKVMAAKEEMPLVPTTDNRSSSNTTSIASSSPDSEEPTKEPYSNNGGEEGEVENNNNETTPSINNVAYILDSNCDNELVHSTVEAPSSSTTTPSAARQERPLGLVEERDEQQLQNEKGQEQRDEKDSTTPLLDNDQQGASGSITTSSRMLTTDEPHEGGNGIGSSGDNIVRSIDNDDAVMEDDQAAEETAPDEQQQAENNESSEEADQNQEEVSGQDTNAADANDDNQDQQAMETDDVAPAADPPANEEAPSNEESNEAPSEEANNEASNNDNEASASEETNNADSVNMLPPTESPVRSSAKNFKEVVAPLVLIAIALVVVVILPNILGIEGSLWLSHVAVGAFILGIQCLFFIV